jgi:3'(2'), 5'-bisphosphate nucleotidase
MVNGIPPFGVLVPTFDIAACAELMEPLTAISMSAAEAIQRSRGEGGVRSKADGSPVTTADEAAEAMICEGLARLDPALPVISEERAEREKPAINSASFILVDPLDGTREFVAGRDEYTINIGLVSDGAPLLGIIAAPALGLIWRGIVGRGAERLEFSSRKRSSPNAIRTRQRPRGELLVMVSRSHLDAQTQAYLDGLPRARAVPSGSSVKFCVLAEGAADLYPRFGPTRDWDVAAGHAILAAAGGSVLAPGGAPLTYGTPELRIPSFVACGDPEGMVARG